MEPFTTVKSALIPLLRDDVDTDQIIPARFLKVTEKAGLGARLFADWRYDADGSVRPEFVLNLPENADRCVLFAGDNFGCGSSREHAPWALADWGIKVVIATSFADIFKNNAMSNGIVPLVVSSEVHSSLRALLDESPVAEVTVDLAARTLSFGSIGNSVSFDIDPFAQKCMLSGTDKLGYILSFADRIETFESERAGD